MSIDPRSPKRSRILPTLVPVVLLGALTAGCVSATVERSAPSAPPAGEDAARDGRMSEALDESAEVVRTVERFHEALSSGDTATVLSLLVPGAHVVEGGGIETREEYAAHHLGADVEFLRGLRKDEGHLHAWVEGDAAWAVSTTDLAGRAGDREITLRSAELVVLVRGPEGWRIAAVHWSSRSLDPR